MRCTLPGAGRARWGTVVCLLLLVLLLPCVAYAEDPPQAEEPPPPPPSDPKAPSDPKVVEPPGEPLDELLLLGPAPDVRARPPEPPPPGSEVPNWDMDHLDPDADVPKAPPPPDRFPLRPILYRHDTRVGSLDGRRMPLRRIPQWVDVIERNELEEWRPMNIGALARRYPNMMVGDSGSPFLEVPWIRGLGRDRVKIVTDGVWPGVQALGAQGGSLSLWDPESTQRVEIYHGPGAFLRAIDSPGGLINIVPRRPRRHGDFSGDGRVVTAYDTATKGWRNRIETDVGQDRTSILAGVTYTQVGDRNTGGGTIAPTSYNQFAADFAMDYFLGPQNRIGFTGQYMRATDIETPFATSTAASAPQYERIFLALTLSSFDLGDVFHGHRFSVAFDTFLQNDDRTILGLTSGIGSDDQLTKSDFHVEGNLYLFEGHNTWAELSIGWARLRRTETLLCVDEDDPRDPTTPNPNDPNAPPKPDLPFKKISEGAGTYADLTNCEPVTREFTAEELLVSALIEDQWHKCCYDAYLGLRLDYWYVNDSRFGKSESSFLLGGAGGLAWHYTPQVTGYVNASLGQRRPTIYERGATEVIDGRVVFGNPDLNPEIHGQVELGVKSSFKNRLSYQAAIFTHYVNDYIRPRDLAGGTNQELVNDGDAFLSGVELTSAWRPFTTREGLEIFGSFGTTRSSDTSVVPNVPILWRTGARYSVPQPKGYIIRRWFTELSAYGASNSAWGLTGGDHYVTGDFIVGAAVDFACRRAGWLHLGITNLADADYTPPRAVLPAPGLSFFASLALDL